MNNRQKRHALTRQLVKNKLSTVLLALSDVVGSGAGVEVLDPHQVRALEQMSERLRCCITSLEDQTSEDLLPEEGYAQ